MKYFLFLLNIVALSIFAEESLSEKLVIKNPEMFIFVHGTIKPAEFSFSSLVKIMNDIIDNTLYSLAANYLRKDPLFYLSQAMQEEGLKPISLTLDNTTNTARTIALLYNQQFQALGINADSILYYTFGWNGLLSDKKRYQEAEKFYKELKKELAILSEKGIYPRITIIGYSHGANVALYLAAVRNNNQEFINDTFTIEKLVMLGAPIQKETDYLVADDLFGKIYHFYSTEDNVQIADIFSSKQLFSSRLFVDRKDFKVPEKKLHQVRLRLTKEIKLRHKAHNIKVQHEILAHPLVKLIHKDPGHAELWNFKWGAYWYRETCPINPLPVVAFVPAFLHTIDQHPELHYLTLDYAPTEYGVLVSHKKKNFKQSKQFLNPEIHVQLWDFANLYKPEDYSFKTQQKQVANALKKAQKDLEILGSYRRPRSKILANYMKQISQGYFDDAEPKKSLYNYRIARLK